MNLARMQHSINWFKAGGHFDVEHYEKVIEAKKTAPQHPKNPKWYLAIKKTVFPIK